MALNHYFMVKVSYELDSTKENKNLYVMCKNMPSQTHTTPKILLFQPSAKISTLLNQNFKHIQKFFLEVTVIDTRYLGFKTSIL